MSTPDFDLQNVPPMSDAELERLGEIAELRLLDGQKDAVLDELTRTAAQRLNLPVGLVSIVTDGVQYFAGSHGLGGWIAEANGTPKEWSFCQHVVERSAPLVVENASEHALVKDSPLVAEDGVSTYAGVPLVTRKGNTLGSFCVLGGAPRKFTDDELQQLRQLADEAVARIEQRREGSA